MDAVLFNSPSSSDSILIIEILRGRDEEVTH